MACCVDNRLLSENGSEVYACLMDLSEAFDRIKHSALFWKLLKKGMPPVYVRLLLVMYEKQKRMYVGTMFCPRHSP